jgi:hypothetical protein
LYAAQVYRFQHRDISLPDYGKNGKRSTCWTFPPVY